MPFLIPNDVKIYLRLEPTDMRKSINTLSILVSYVLELDPSSGHLFLFHNRYGDKLKALYYEKNNQLWQSKYESLLEQLKLTKLRQFGASSEKSIAQGELFDEAGAPEIEEIKEDVIIVETHQRKRQPKRVKLPDH